MVVSLRYHSTCLKDLCPEFEHVSGESIRFFIPTKNEVLDDYFAYIEIKKSIMQRLCDEKYEAHIVNIPECAKILHIEKGLFPSSHRVQEIEGYFESVPEYYDHLHHYSDLQQCA